MAYFAGTSGSNSFTGTNNNDYFEVGGTINTNDFAAGRLGFDFVSGAEDGQGRMFADLTNDGGVFGYFYNPATDAFISSFSGTSIEGVYGTSFGDSFAGSTRNDFIAGLGGDDSMNGGDGADRLYGGSGDDSMGGGDGNDRMFGQLGDDSMYGGEGNDYMLGQGNRDDMHGGNGDDILGGGGNDDFVDGQFGNDQVYGGLGNDQVRGGFGADLVNGQGGDDFVIGEEDEDQVQGMNGNDSLYGGFHSDDLDGGAGNDDYYGDSVADPSSVADDYFVVRQDDATATDIIWDYNHAVTNNDNPEGTGETGDGFEEDRLYLEGISSQAEFAARSNDNSNLFGDPAVNDTVVLLENGQVVVIVDTSEQEASNGLIFTDPFATS